MRTVHFRSEGAGRGHLGDGAIDGRGGGPLLGAAGRDPRGGSVTWWDLAKEAKVKDLHQSCPGLIVARESDNFTLYRITLRNAAKAHVVADKLDGFTAWGVKIKTPKTARNTDGINPQSSTNVTIAHCSIDTGDDNVAVKAGANAPCRTSPSPITTSMPDMACRSAAKPAAGSTGSASST